MLDRLSLGPGDSAAQSPSDSQKRRVSALQLHSTETGVSLCLQVKGRGSAEVESKLPTQVAPLGVVSRRHGAARTAGLELLVQTSNVHMTHQRASVSADGVSSAVRRTAGFKYSFCSGELPRVFLFLW